jgi:hypothetical protein
VLCCATLYLYWWDLIYCRVVSFWIVLMLYSHVTYVRVRECWLVDCSTGFVQSISRLSKYRLGRWKLGIGSVFSIKTSQQILIGRWIVGRSPQKNTTYCHISAMLYILIALSSILLRLLTRVFHFRKKAGVSISFSPYLQI